jgi:SAM-dependent methyltransferase
MPQPAQWDTGSLLRLSGAYWQACALHTAVKLGLFSVLDREGQSAEETAGRLGTSLDGTERLLNALVSMKLLVKTENGFANSPAASKLLVKDSAQYIGPILMHHHHLMPAWAELAQAVRTGAPVRHRASFGDPEVRESFLMGMFNMAMTVAPRIVSALDLSNSRRLLDLGGGPGTYAVHFCLQHEHLRATVFDLPSTRQFAEKTIARFGVAERVRFQEGDYLKDPLMGTYDAVWLSHILHGEGPQDGRKIIAKAVGALNPGGLIAVHEFILDDDMAGPLFPALFSLNMLLGTDAGRAYTQSQLSDMLKAAGVSDIRRLPLETPNDSGILVGRIKTARGSE